MDPPSNAQGPNRPAPAGNAPAAPQPAEGARVRRQLDAADPADPPVARNVRPRRDAMAPPHAFQQGVFAEAAAALPVPRERAAPAAAAPAQQNVDLIASISDNRIGSVYFPEGRMRTTHYAGPEISGSPPAGILRFNINVNQSWEQFHRAQPNFMDWAAINVDPDLPAEQRAYQLSEHVLDMREEWMAHTLRQSDPLPAWAQPVTTPDSVEPAEAINPEDGRVLFEIYTPAPGGEVSWHTSRGVAARISLPQPTISALTEAFRQIEGVTDVNERNSRFYDYLSIHAPDFARMIRRP